MRPFNDPPAAGNAPSNWIQPLACFGIIACIAWFVYAPMLSLAFWGDDTFLMKLAAKYNIVALLFKGPARSISQNNFMPLLGLTFYADHVLFGFDFLGRNLHSLFWLAVVGCMAHVLLRQLGLPLGSAVAGGITIIISPATVSVAGHYANRHYLFGLAFGLASLILVNRWSERNSTVAYRAALLFYFLALASKEIYAPLPVVSGFLVWQRRADLKKAVIGFSSVLSLYLLLRWLMLGSVIGGYTSHIEWETMLAYLWKSAPRLVQTLVWGGAEPGQILPAAVAAGGLIIGITIGLAMITCGLRGVLCFIGLLGLSLCVVSFALYTPPIRYAEDPFYCHGDRLALAFSTATWFTFWYLTGRRPVVQWIAGKSLLVLAVVIIIPLTFMGGRAKAHHWKKTKATIEQAQFIQAHASEKWLVVGHPTWFLRHYVSMLGSRNPGTRIRAMDQSAVPNSLPADAFDTGVRLQPDTPIATSRDKTVLMKWMADFSKDYCRLFPERCP